MNEKKILHIIYSGLGGQSADFFNLTNNTFNHISLFAGIEPLNIDNEERCIEGNVPYYFLLKKQGLDLRFYYQIFKILKREHPNIILLHGGSFLLPVIIYKIIKINTKLIIRDTQAAHLKKKSEWLFLILAHFLCDKLIFLTEESRNSLKEKIPFWFNKSKTLIISNGIETNKYKRLKINNTYKKPVIIGMQSRLQLIKDHPTLIKAFSLLIKTYSSYELELHIAGDGVTMQTLTALVASLNLDHQVVFHGMLNDSELLDFMNNLDIYVHATFGETMSNSILQAMSFSLPIIASNVWGVNNLIINKHNGLLYESENIEDLVYKIHSFLDEPNVAKRLANMARNEVEALYSVSLMKAKHEQIFLELSKQ